MARINFIELPAGDLGAAKAFYGSVFGWDLTDFGPSYSCTTTGDVDLGLQGDASEATRAPLAVIAFPGGRRFHFTDPNGLELAALKAD